MRAIEEPQDNRRMREERKLHRRMSRSCFLETTRIEIDKRVIREEARTPAVLQPGLRAMAIREIQERRTRGEWKLHRIIQEERAPRVGQTTRRVRPRLRRLAERNPRAELLRPMQVRIAVDPHGTARKCFSVRRRRTAVPAVKARPLRRPVLLAPNRLAMTPLPAGLKAVPVEGMAADIVEYRPGNHATGGSQAQSCPGFYR